jgi:hypothetical protein
VSVLSRLRDRRPPTEATKPLDRDERIVSWGRAAGGDPVVATQRGLWLPDAAGPRRIGWHLVDKATWQAGTLTVIEAVETGGGVLAERPPVTVRLAEPRDLPATIRARVERSISYSRHYPLAPSGGVRVVGRRVPGQDGLSWQLVFDAGTDGDDPLLRIQAERLVANAKVETGSA